MKKKLVFLSTTLLLLLGQACGIWKSKNANNLKLTNTIYDKTWKLMELNGVPVANEVNGKEPFISFDSESQRYSASGGCNGMGGTFEIKQNTIQFSQGMSTMMACPDMSVENGLRLLFGKNVQYEINQTGDLETLILKEGKNVIAKFTNNPSHAAEQLSGTWELDYISGPRIAFEGLYPDKKPTIQFDVSNGRVFGIGGCNNYNGSVTINNQQITFGPLAATKMMCPQIQGEETFFKTLEKINKFSVNNGQLTLIMGDIAMMRFKKI